MVNSVGFGKENARLYVIKRFEDKTISAFENPAAPSP
jgi:hypothetical protein